MHKSSSAAANTGFCKGRAEKQKGALCNTLQQPWWTDGGASTEDGPESGSKTQCDGTQWKAMYKEMHLLYHLLTMFPHVPAACANDM